MGDHERCQKSKRDLQLAFEREKDEWFCLQDKINFDISSLKDDNDILCQEISKVENKFSRLEIELNQARDDLREKTLVLEGVQRDITQTQCQRKEIEHLCKKKKDKLQQIIENQRSLEEELSHLQSENKLLRQQLDDAHNKAGDEEMTVINTQDQFQDIIKGLQTKNEQQRLILNERNKELKNECIHFKQKIHEYENAKTERDAFVSQLQQELADTLRKQCVLEALLQIYFERR
ncbi:ankyrin repeat domain-containing protein 26-like [Molossus nigricans]